MKFGGHETFVIREGWLHKGLDLLINDPEKLVSEYASDWLGVGRNMAKSIRHWLNTCGLAGPNMDVGKRKILPLQPTELAKLIWDQDRYLLDVGTWWVLHTNLVTNKDHALTWTWFFNSFAANRFERTVCYDVATRHFEQTGMRMPSRRTLERDIACLLQTYSQVVPPHQGDPEDVKECPLSELGLLRHHRRTSVYEVNRKPKKIDPAIFGYALSRCFRNTDIGLRLDIELHELWKRENNPARIFCLDNESFFEGALSAAEDLRSGELQIIGLAGQRVLRMEIKRDIDWLKMFYRRTRESEMKVAL